MVLGPPAGDRKLWPAEKFEHWFIETKQYYQPYGSTHVSGTWDRTTGQRQSRKDYYEQTMEDLSVQHTGQVYSISRTTYLMDKTRTVRCIIRAPMLHNQENKRRFHRDPMETSIYIIS